MWEYEIANFWTKLMTATKTINKIPDYYLTYAQNARIYDKWIGPRLGKKLFCQLDWEWKFAWSFVLAWNIYFVYANKIYKLLSDWTYLELFDYETDKKITSILYNWNNVLISSPLKEFSSILNSWTSFSSSWTNMYKVYASWVYNLTPSQESLYLIKRLPSSRWNSSINRYVVPETWQTYLYETVVIWYATFYAVDSINKFVTITNFSWKYEEGAYFVFERQGRHVVSNFTISDYDLMNVTSESNTSAPISENIDSWLVVSWIGHTFAAKWANLYISSELDYSAVEWVTNFYTLWGHFITLDSDIKAIKTSMDWVYVFTEKFLYSIDRSSASIKNNYPNYKPRLIGEVGEIINHFSVCVVGDKIFYMTKNLNIWCINYKDWTTFPWIFDLSAQTWVWIRELLWTFDSNQDEAFAFYSDYDKLLQFHLKLKDSPHNNIVLFYDINNDTWGIDTNKSYSDMIELNQKIYSFSASDWKIFIENSWYLDEWEKINFKIATKNLSFDTNTQKLFNWFFVSGVISEDEELKVSVYIDSQKVFEDNIKADTNKAKLNYISNEKSLIPFDLYADAGSINICWDRILFEFENKNSLWDFLIDTLWIKKEKTGLISTINKF